MAIYHSKYLKNNTLEGKEKTTYVSKYLDKTPKRGLNPYFSFNTENYDTSNEVNLVKRLQEEQIRMYGYNITYILRTQNTLDQLYGEAVGSNFTHSFRIEAMPETTDLMLGRDSIMGYGYAMTDTVVLYVAFDRIKDEIKRLGVEGRDYPLAGDLIAFDIPGNIMEVRYVEDKVVPYAKGTWSIIALSCQVYNLGQETFTTGDEQIDILNHFDKHYELPNSDNESIRKEAQTIAIQESNIWNFNSQEDVKY